MRWFLRRVSPVFIKLVSDEDIQNKLKQSKKVYIFQKFPTKQQGMHNHRLRLELHF